MQEVQDRRTGQEYTALLFSQFTKEQRMALNRHLRCRGCESVAHFRRASEPGPGRRGRIAHFYCRPHGKDCEIISRNEDAWEAEESDATVARWEERNQTLIVRIQTSVEESESAPTETIGNEMDSRTGRGGARTRNDKTVSRGPQRLLEQLVQWPSFKTSALSIRMPDPAQTVTVPVYDAFVRFEDARVEKHTNRWLGFWGIIRSLRYWARGSGYYSNFGSEKSSFRIFVRGIHVDAILKRYHLESIDDLLGNYLLLFDIARESTSGRFTADVNSIQHIGFLRYDGN